MTPCIASGKKQSCHDAAGTRLGVDEEDEEEANKFADEEDAPSETNANVPKFPAVPVTEGKFPAVPTLTTMNGIDSDDDDEEANKFPAVPSDDDLTQSESGSPLTPKDATTPDAIAPDATLPFRSGASASEASGSNAFSSNASGSNASGLNAFSSNLTASDAFSSNASGSDASGSNASGDSCPNFEAFGSDSCSASDAFGSTSDASGSDSEASCSNFNDSCANAEVDSDSDSDSDPEDDAIRCAQCYDDITFNDDSLRYDHEGGMKILVQRGIHYAHVCNQHCYDRLTDELLSESTPEAHAAVLTTRIQQRQQDLEEDCRQDILFLFLYMLFHKINPEHMNIECPLNVRLGPTHTRLHFCSNDPVRTNRSGKAVADTSKLTFTCQKCDCVDDPEHVAGECTKEFTSLRSLQRHYAHQHPDSLGNPFHWSKVQYGQLMDLFYNPYPHVCAQCFETVECHDPLCCDQRVRRKLIQNAESVLLDDNRLVQWYGLELRPYHKPGATRCRYAMKPNVHMFTDLVRLRHHVERPPGDREKLQGRPNNHGKGDGTFTQWDQYSMGDKKDRFYKPHGKPWGGNGTLREFDPKRHAERLNLFASHAKNVYQVFLERQYPVSIYDFQAYFNEQTYQPLVRFRRMSPEKKEQMCTPRKKRTLPGSPSTVERPHKQSKIEQRKVTKV